MADDSQNFFDDFTKKINAVIDSVGDAFKSNLDPSRVTTLMKELDDQATTVIATFNQGRENILGIKQAMADAVVSVKGLGGSFQDVVDIQNNLAKSLGRNLILASDSYEGLYAASKASNQEASYIVESFKNVGISVYDSSKQIEGVLNTAREIGVSGTKVTDEVLANIDMLNKYNFKNGVDGLAKMAAQAVNLRINVREIGNTLDKAFNPESAIEMAAAFQRLGVTQSDLLDPLRLMDLAQNDPAELQNQIAEMTKQFVTLNEAGQFEILPGGKRQLMEIASAAGMSYDSVTKLALGSAELKDKMSKISFPDTFTEEQKTMIANMAEMKGGEYKLQVGGEELGIVEAMERLQAGGDEAMNELLESSKPKKLEDLTFEQLGYEKAMAASLAKIEDRLPYAIASMRATTQGQTKIIKGAKVISDSFDTDNLSVKNLRGEFTKLYDGVSTSITQNGVDFTNLSKTVNEFGTYLNTSFKESFKNVDTSLDEAVGFKISDLLKTMDESLTKNGTLQGNENQSSTANPGTTQTATPSTSTQTNSSTNNNSAVNNLNNTALNTTNTNVTETKTKQDITLTIKVESGNIPESKILEVLNKTDTITQINKSISGVNTGNGLLKS